MNHIRRVAFSGVEPAFVASGIRSQYRKLGYSIVDTDADANTGKGTYVARKAGKRIRYVIVPAGEGKANAKGMVTFFWRE